MIHGVKTSIYAQRLSHLYGPLKTLSTDHVLIGGTRFPIEIAIYRETFPMSHFFQCTI